MSEDINESLDQNEEQWFQHPQFIRSTCPKRRPKTYSSNFQSSFSLLSHDGEPSSFQKARESRNVDKWKKSMDEEMNALQKNQTCELVDLPIGMKVAVKKWVYKLRRMIDGLLEHYKTHLVEKGYVYKYRYIF